MRMRPTSWIQTLLVNRGELSALSTTLAVDRASVSSYSSSSPLRVRVPKESFLIRGRLEMP
jgi:hypothetical protein